MVKPLFEKGAKPKTPRTGVFGDQPVEITERMQAAIDDLSEVDRILCAPLVVAHAQNKIDLLAKIDEYIKLWHKYESNTNDMNRELSDRGDVVTPINRFVLMRKWRDRLSILKGISAVSEYFRRELLTSRALIEERASYLSTLLAKVSVIDGMVQRLNEDCRIMLTTISTIEKGGEFSRDLSDRVRVLAHCKNSLDLVEYNLRVLSDGVSSRQLLVREVQEFFALEGR